TGLLIALLTAIGQLASRPAFGARLDFFLTVDQATETWELAASTDSPGGIAGFSVNLVNFGVGINVAPRSWDIEAIPRGLWFGYQKLPVPGKSNTSPVYGQAFAAQHIDPEGVVYGIGFEPVPDSAFGVVSSD